MENCLFCKIVSKEIKASIVDENDDCIVIVDINQALYGHLLVIPKKHYENFSSIDNDDLIKSLFTMTHKWGKALKSKLGVEDYNIIINNGAIANQEVMHLHIHIIPRRDEKLYAFIETKNLSEEETTNLIDKLKSN